MNVFNLAEFAKLETDPIKAGILMNLLRASPILGTLPFVPVDSLQNIAVRWKDMPQGAGWRKVNEGYQNSVGSFEQVVESVYAFGTQMDLDQVFGLVKNVVGDPQQQLLLQHTTALGLRWNWYFVNGDHAIDPDGIDGLRKRIANMPARQTIAAATGTGSLNATADAASARRFINRFEEAMYKANGGDVQAILVNENLKWGLGRALRYIQASGGNWLDVTKDSFDREVFTYKGRPIMDMGLDRDQVTEVITNTEDPGDGVGDCTSAYFVPFNMEQGITGIQLNDPSVKEIGELEDKPSDRWRVDWWNGLAGFGSHGPTRLKQIMDPSQWTE